MTFLDKVIAIVRRDVLTAIRYRSAFGMQVAGLLAQLVGLYFLARAIGTGFQPDGMSYFPFLFVGGGLYTFIISGVSGFISSVHDAQMTGTMEVLMTTSTPAALVVALTALSNLAMRLLSLAAYLVIGFLIFPVGGLHANLAGVAVIFVLTIGVAVAVGVLAAAIQVATQKGGVVVWLMATFGWFLTGSMFPVTSLPSMLQKLARLIPFTYALTASRQALLQGASLAQLQPAILVLSISCLVLLPTAFVVFAAVMRSARLRGALSFY